MLFQLALLGRDVELLSADFRFVEVSLLSLIMKAKRYIRSLIKEATYEEEKPFAYPSPVFPRWVFFAKEHSA